MKKHGLTKIQIVKKILSRYFTLPFRKASNMIGNDFTSTSNLQIPSEEQSDTSLTYEELRRINAQMVEMEKCRAEAIQYLRERNRFV
jgi:hypothetical protein